MIIETPDGQVEFPDSMSREEIDQVMRQRYGDPPSPEERGSLDWADIGKGAAQGVRDLGENIMATPRAIDDLGRAAIEWLQKVKPSPGYEGAVSNTIADYANATGDYLAAHNIGEGGQMSPLPNAHDADWMLNQIIGPDYEPKTRMGQMARAGTHYAIPGGLGARAAFGAWRMLPGVAKKGIGFGGAAAAGAKAADKAWNFATDADYTGWQR